MSVKKQLIKIIRPTWGRRPINPYWSQIRAGVIFYHKDCDGKINFLFGHNNKTNEFDDFSSSVRVIDKTPENTLIRAVNQKTLGLIKIDENTLSLKTSIFIQDYYSLIVLIELKIEDVPERFKQIVDEGCYTRFDHIKWINQDELINIITYEKSIIKRQVRCMIRDINKIINLL